MKIYFINPLLTIGHNDLANDFFNISVSEIEEYVKATPIMSMSSLQSIDDLVAGDIIIFFNRSGQDYNEHFLSFLMEGIETRVEVLPIALDKEYRVPPINCTAQSYDIYEALRQRRLTSANMATVAFAFARIVIARVQPTISKEDMQIFISHRRLDGEEVAASFYEAFVIRAEKAFRDLIDIRVGKDAQDIIEDNLTKSDVVIFIDTPKTGESYWIRRELSIALALNIPIVWVKIGDNDGRVPLEVIPCSAPHFAFTYEELTPPEIIDSIIHKAFTISRKSANHVFDKISMLKSISKNNGLRLRKIDDRNMIYRIEIPRKGFRYYQKPLVQLVQCYGRRHKEEEFSRIEQLLNGLGYITHPEYGSLYDTAILLSPICNAEVTDDKNIITESFDNYLKYLNDYLQPEKTNTGKGIILSGAFPDCEPEFQQYLTDAIYSFTKAIFQRDGSVIFGAHPTFQHLIFDMARIQRPNDICEAVRLYISKYFVTDPLIEDLGKYAKVTATENISNSRDDSLSLMRKKMILDDTAIALVCLGGKTSHEGHRPGVDEEIALAKSRGLPVFIIGSVGGRSSELAQYYFDNNYKDKINGMSRDENIELMTSQDYQHIANKILDYLGV